MAVKFLKIDYLKCKKYKFFFCIPLIALVFLVGKDSTTPALFGLGYCLFIGLIMSNVPANSEVKGERGFLQMLPAKPGSDIKGHFLFAALCILFFTVFAFVIIAISKLINPGLRIFEVGGIDVKGMYLVMVGIALAVSGFELMILTIFRYKSVMVQQLLRIVPALVFFFAMTQISDQAATMKLPELSYGFDTGSIVIFVVCIVLFVVFSEVSTRVVVSRE